MMPPIAKPSLDFVAANLSFVSISKYETTALQIIPSAILQRSFNRHPSVYLFLLKHSKEHSRSEATPRICNEMRFPFSSFQMPHRVVMLSWLSLLALLSFKPSCHVQANKKLVMFAGPHKSASTSIESFFYEYASGHSRYGDDGKKSKDEREKTFGLRYWLWPRISGVIVNTTEKEEPYKIYGHLVTDHDNSMLRDEILNGIRDAWETNGIEGVVLGTEMFDQIGDYAPYDAIRAMHKIVDYVQVEPNDVTVALNYRTPRLEQWAAMWAHATQTGQTNYTAEYDQWLCDENNLSKHVEVLQTQMNPLNAAATFVKEGWNVRLVDMGGVDKAGRDINHVIACDVMTARCDNGDVLNHHKDKPHENSVKVEFAGLSEEQREEAEQLFRARDCAYVDELRTNVQFAVIYNDTLWENCDPTLGEVYNKLREDPSYMFKALLSQIQCPGGKRPVQDMVSMHTALTGEVPKAERKKRKSGTKRTAGGILLELLAFVCIVGGAMGYQYHRMVQEGNPLVRGAHQIDTAAALEEAELEGQFANNAAVDAEYGDADSDDDEQELPTSSGYRD